MKLTRPELDDLLVDYLYDELSDEQRAAFEAALDEHPELAAEVAAHRRTRRVAQSLPEVTLAPAAFARIEDAVMAAARQAVPAPAAPAAPAASDDEAPTLWQRILAVLFQPTFATAAAAVLVAGVVVGLRARTGDGPPAATHVAVNRPLQDEPVFAQAAEPPAMAEAPATQVGEGHSEQDELQVAGFDAAQATQHEELAMQAAPAPDEALELARAEAAAREARREVVDKRALAARSRSGAEKSKSAGVRRDVARLQNGGRALQALDDAYADGRRAAAGPAAPRGQVQTKAAREAEAPPQVAGGMPAPAPTAARVEPAAPAPADGEADAQRESAAKLQEAAAGHLARGEYAKAREALQKLAALPGHEQTAKKKLEEVAAAEKAAAERAAAEDQARRKGASKVAPAESEPVPAAMPRKSAY